MIRGQVVAEIIMPMVVFRNLTAVAIVGVQKSRHLRQHQLMDLVDQLMEAAISMLLTPISVHLVMLAVLVAVAHGVGLAVDQMADQALLVQPI